MIYDSSSEGVVTSSELRVAFAVELCDEHSILSTSNCYIDGCKKTLKEKWTEVKIVIYHPLLKQVVWLAKLKSPGLTESA